MARLLGDPMAWHDRGVLGCIQDVVRQADVDPEAVAYVPDVGAADGSPWALLRALTSVPDFHIEEPLREMADRHNSIFHTFFLALWEIRFLRETQDEATLSRLIQSLGVWLQGEPLDRQTVRDLVLLGVGRRVSGEAEKLDLLLFLLTLAAQNGLVRQVFAVMDNLESAERARLKELVFVVEACTRWAKIPGMPLGLVLGWDGHIPGLGKANAKLASYLTQGVV